MSQAATVRWYSLEDSSRPIGVALPGIVPVLPLEGHSEPVRFWTDRGQGRIPRYPASQRVDGPQEGDEARLALEDAEDNVPEPDEGLLDDADGEGAESHDELLADLAEQLAKGGFEDPEPQPDTDGGDANASGAAAACSGAPEDPPAAPAPAEDAGDAPQVPPRKGASVTYFVPGGSISYYRSKSCFEAVCCAREHGRCVLTRTCRGRPSSGSGSNVVGGRPVGFLAHWLGHAEQCEDKADHWLPARFLGSQAERAALRQQIAGTRDGRLLLSFERERAEGEPEEPASLHGYVDVALLA